MARTMAWGAAAVALTLASPATAGSYVYTTIDVPGSVATFPVGINKSRQVVGSYRVSQPAQQEGGFVWNGGTLRLLALGRTTLLSAIDQAGLAAGFHDVGNGYEALLFYPSDGTLRRPLRAHPRGLSTVLTGINDDKTAVGYMGKGALTSGIVWRNGRITQVQVPDGGPTQLLGINNLGVSFGQQTQSFQWFTYDRGTATMLPLPRSAIVSGIGDDGKVTGSMVDQGHRQGSQAFVVDGTVVHTFRWHGVVGGQSVIADYNGAVATSDTGVFGNYGFIGDVPTSFGYVKRGDTFYTLSPPGASFTQIVAANRDGTIVGFYDTGKFGAYVEHGFIAVCPPDQRPCTQ